MIVKSQFEMTNNSYNQYYEDKNYKEYILKCLAVSLAEEIIKSELCVLNIFDPKVDLDENDPDYNFKQIKQAKLSFSNTVEIELIVDVNPPKTNKNGSTNNTSR